jgi:hypothetical protein
MLPHWSERLNESNIMSHDDFILGYQNGRLGCSVSTLLTLRLFLAGRIREKRVVISLVGWSLGLVLLIGLSTIGFLCLPALWALLGATTLLAIFALGFTYQIAGLIVSTALANKQFYEFVKSQRALWVSTDGEVNLPKLSKLAPMKPPRRAQR